MNKDINKQLQTVIGNLIGKDYFKLEFGVGIKLLEGSNLIDIFIGHSVENFPYCFYRKSVNSIINTNYYYEILGQEPTLNDVLLAIEKTGVGIYVITTQGHICELTSSRPEDILFKIDLEKSIFNQSDETKLAIIKLLE